MVIKIASNTAFIDVLISLIQNIGKNRDDINQTIEKPKNPMNSNWKNSFCLAGENVANCKIKINDATAQPNQRKLNPASPSASF